jgi:catechol 2,3-dioxygenase-like lactoylglutathione lyase family enzyme
MSDGAAVALRLEVVTVPVSDVDRAKSFYESLGWRLDADFTAGEEIRAVQFTPPQSRCSIHFSNGLTDSDLLHETSERHGAFEAVAPPHDWWDWYAAYMDARQSGSAPDDASAAADRYMAEVKNIVVPSS